MKTSGDVFIPYSKSYTNTTYISSSHPEDKLDITGMYATMLNTYTQARLACIKFRHGEVIINYSLDSNLLIQDKERISDMVIL